MSHLNSSALFFEQQISVGAAVFACCEYFIGATLSLVRHFEWKS